MKKPYLFLIIQFYFVCFQIVAQNKKIEQIENNLLESQTLIFTDTLYPKYTIEQRMKHYKVPSVSIALINNGKVEWTKAYGYIDANNQKIANTTTLYQVASISKSVNGLAVMKLAENKKLSLTKDIRSYLKTWSFPENEFSKGKTITLKNLLSHTAGFNVRGFIGYPNHSKIPTINEILDGEKPANNEAIKPNFKVNEHFEYSGGGYTILRKILDDAVSNDFDKLLNQLLFKPLKMNNSTFSQPLSTQYKNFAFAHNQEMQPIDGNFYIYPEKAAGGLWSTAADIAKFVIAIQSSIQGKPNAILSKESANEMLTPILNNYALGFGIMEKGGEKYFRHEGENMGFISVYYGSFTTGNGLVILTNAYPNNGKPFIEELVNSIATTYQWKDFYQPIEKKLVFIPKDILMKYVGEYQSNNPPIKIKINHNKGQLELTARRPEKLYAIGENQFFVPSSPNDKILFSSSKNDGNMDVLEVKQGDKTIIKAIKL